MKRYIILRLLLMSIFFFSVLVEAASKPPQRIVSLGPAITKGLYLLGVEDKLVGCTLYCQDPPGAKLKEKIGTVIDVDVEKIASLKPDLVLATSLTDPKAIEKFKKLKIKSVIFPTAINFPQIGQQFLELGKLVGKGKKAKAIVEKAEHQAKIINEKVKKLSRPKLFLQTGAKPLYTPNKDSFVHDCIVRAGGINIAADSIGRFGGGIYSREEAIRQNPDVIIIVTMGITGESEKSIWEKFKTLTAVKNNRIYIIDAHKLCSPTPLSFVEALEEIAFILHPNEWERIADEE